MTDDLNHATRRLLQVVLDMLRNPAADKPPEDERYPPPKYRTDAQCVEAAWRAANEAQQMLAESRASAAPQAAR